MVALSHQKTRCPPMCRLTSRMLPSSVGGRYTPHRHGSSYAQPMSVSWSLPDYLRRMFDYHQVSKQMERDQSLRPNPCFFESKMAFISYGTWYHILSDARPPCNAADVLVRGERIAWARSKWLAVTFKKLSFTVLPPTVLLPTPVEANAYWSMTNPSPLLMLLLLLLLLTLWVQLVLFRWTWRRLQIRW